MVMSAPLGGGVDRIIVCEQEAPPRRRTGPPHWTEVADAWKRLTGEHLHDAEATWVSAFSDAARQVTQYQRGRVLLAGDAAHIHLPAGGQGMSIGIQDAVNLGWKLAATVKGWAPAELLGTYHSERHPVAARVLRNTRAQGFLYLSGSEVEPLRAVFAQLMARPAVGRYLSGAVSGLDIRYEVGSGDHPLLGRRIPNLLLHGRRGDVSTAALLKTARGVLVGDTARLAQVAAPWADRVDVVEAGPAPAHDLRWPDGTSAVLIRPDGYVAWAGPGEVDLTVALQRWFGAPGPRHRSESHHLAGAASGQPSKS
jgi:bifunctional hydroxylase/dehydrase